MKAKRASKKQVTNKTKVRVAMIGAGKLSTAMHYPSLASFKDVEFAAVCDLNTERLDATADKYGIERRYTDYRKMIEDVAPDGVYAVGEPHVMYDVWTWCLEHGLNLFVEKPLGLNIHQAQCLTHLAEKHGCMTQVGFQRRSAPILVKVREECLKRGPIVHAVCEFFKCEMTPFLGACDHAMGDCVHSIDTVRWMCGGEVIDVESHCKRIGVPDINWIGATLYFDNGSVGYVINTWASGRRVFRVQMHAPGIYTDAELEAKAYVYADNDYNGVEYDTKEVAGSDDIIVYGGFRAKNREFIDSLKTGKEQTTSPFTDAVKTMEVAEVIRAQALLNGE